MKPVRINTVSSIYRENQSGLYQVPYIRLSGLWLRWLGFEPGGKMEIAVGPDCITIKPTKIKTPENFRV